MNKQLSAFAAISALLVLGALAIAQDAAKGASICGEVQAVVNEMVDYTRTSCIPAGGKAGAISFICISDKPVFSVEASKKAWMLVMVASLGKTLNEQPSVKVDELYLSDANLMKNRTAYVLRAELARSLQRQIYSDQISLDEMYSTISRSLVKKTITK